METFAAKYPGVVYGFGQSGLWKDWAGAAVPGSTALGFSDANPDNLNTHLSYYGAAYIAPYLCAAFERWGFFDSPPHVDFPSVFRAPGSA